MSVAVRIVGKTGSDVSFSCFPLVGKAVLCYGKDSFWLRKRLFYGVEKAVLRREKGSFGLRKRLFCGAKKALSGCGKGFSGQTKGEWCVAVWCMWLAVRRLP